MRKKEWLENAIKTVFVNFEITEKTGECCFLFLCFFWEIGSPNQRTLELRRICCLTSGKEGLRLLALLQSFRKGKVSCFFAQKLF
jgi:hypothetical protein